MVYAFGGSAEYKGKDLRAAHYHLVKTQGLNTSHFDMVAGHFKSVLLELGVAEVVILPVVNAADVMGCFL